MPRIYKEVSLTKLHATTIVLVLVAVLLHLNPKPALAVTDGYLGAGYFPTSNLTRCFYGNAYSTQAQNAAARWSSDTDLNISYSCSGTPKIQSIYADYGNTGWPGYAFICSSSTCGGAAWSQSYVRCEARVNKYSVDNNPGFYTSAEIQKLYMHEKGHCFSLDHASVVTSVMNNGAVPDAQDINLINARY